MSAARYQGCHLVVDASPAALRRAAPPACGLSQWPQPPPQHDPPPPGEATNARLPPRAFGVAKDDRRRSVRSDAHDGHGGAGASERESSSNCSSHATQA